MKRIACSIVVFIIVSALSAPVIAGEYTLNNGVVMASLTLDEGEGGVYGYSPARRGVDVRRDVEALPLLKGRGDVELTGKYTPVDMNLSVMEDGVFKYPTKNHLDLYRRKAPPLYVPHRSSSMDFELASVVKGSMGRGIVDIGAAVVTQVVLHEAGHYAVADYVDAEGNSLAFLTSRDGQFFLGSSTVTAIDDRSRLPYSMGGEVAADFTFEYALASYRRHPTLYNKALMFLSGTDLLRYTIYAYFISDGHDHLDPIAITKYGGVSKEALITTAVLKSVLNGYRIHSGHDTVIPYFTVDQESASLIFKVVF